MFFSKRNSSYLRKFDAVYSNGLSPYLLLTSPKLWKFINLYCFNFPFVCFQNSSNLNLS